MMRTKSIYTIGLMLSLLTSLLLTSCDVHEMPDMPKEVAHYLQFNFKIDSLSIQDTKYDTRSQKDKATLDWRYIVRAYPILENGKTSQDYVLESIFTRSMSDNYNYNVLLDLPPGNFNVMVWADFVDKGSKANYFYNADNFAEIYLHGKHQANTDNRDAFSGNAEISIVADIIDKEPETTIIEMERPLAKFEFITNDIEEFLGKETRKGADNDMSIDLDDYKIVFYYTGFMPNAYSLFSDKPVDSATGVFFESKLTQINESEASMGFDYIFINGNESITTVNVGLYNTEGQLLSMSEAIEVPIKRSFHTIIKGKFLSQENKGGVNINPEFDDDYNLIFP